jgi:hypothetical protein
MNFYASCVSVFGQAVAEMMAVLNRVSWMFTKLVEISRSIICSQHENVLLDELRGSVVTAVTSVHWYC